MWFGSRLLIGGIIAPPTWFAKANPVWLVGASNIWPGTVGPGDQVAFFAMSSAVAMLLAALAAARLRQISDRQGSAPRFDSGMIPCSRSLERLKRLVPGPSLDGNPVLWREWHRRWPSLWARGVWSLYAAMVIGLSLTLIVLNFTNSTTRREISSVANGFQAGIGLLLLSISAATVLAEERVRGDLDILLTTPLPTGSIVWGKWWGTFRTVPVLAIGPGAVAITLARESGRWEGAALLICLYVAYGAVVTSLGLRLRHGCAGWITPSL